MRHESVISLHKSGHLNMIKVIPKEEIARRTKAMKDAIPEGKRSFVADSIRQYASDMEYCYQQLCHCLKDSFGNEADVVIKEINHHNFDWERSVASRLEGTIDEI